MIKETIKPGEAASVDKLVMCQLGIIYQALEKLTHMRFFGSQVRADHNNRAKHAAYLEDFSVDSTIVTKEEYDRLTQEKGETVAKHRTDNGRCSNNVLMENIKENS